MERNIVPWGKMKCIAASYVMALSVAPYSCLDAEQVVAAAELVVVEM
jgi:hypothetical protein